MTTARQALPASTTNRSDWMEEWIKKGSTRK
jgi:hypothetical protein